MTARQGVVLVVADLPGDLAEAGRDEAGRALRHRDMGTGDGVQVEVPVQGAEDAGGQVIGSGWVAGVTGSGPVNGVLLCGAVLMQVSAPAGGAIGWRPGMKPWSFGIKDLRPAGGERGQVWPPVAVIVVRECCSAWTSARRCWSPARAGS